MRIIFLASLLFVLSLAFAISDVGARAPGQDGRAILRFDTFGDEQLWTNTLRMHEVIATLPPATAFSVGLKVDVDALPPAIVTALEDGKVDLTAPAVTIELLRLNAVVGVKVTVSSTGQ